jgi:hypothetical protein
MKVNKLGSERKVGQKRAKEIGMWTEWKRRDIGTNKLKRK